MPRPTGQDSRGCGTVPEVIARVIGIFMSGDLRSASRNHLTIFIPICHVFSSRAATVLTCIRVSSISGDHIGERTAPSTM
jgi:hypothetical protein